MRLKTMASVCIIGALAACAEKPEAVGGNYVSTALYENLSCQQLAGEARNVSNRAHDAAQIQRRHHTRDEVATAAGLVIFWPALFFVRGNDATTAEVAEMRGTMTAIEQASTAKQCGIVFQRS